MRVVLLGLLLAAKLSTASASEWVVQQGTQAFVDIPFMLATVDSNDGKAGFGLKCYKKTLAKGTDIGGANHMMIMAVAEGIDRPKDQTVEFALRSDTGEQSRIDVKSSGQQFFYASGFDNPDFTEKSLSAVLSAKEHFGILLDGNTYAFSPRNTEDTLKRMATFCGVPD